MSEIHYHVESSYGGMEDGLPLLRNTINSIVQARQVVVDMEEAEQPGIAASVHLGEAQIVLSGIASFAPGYTERLQHYLGQVEAKTASVEARAEPVSPFPARKVASDLPPKQSWTIESVRALREARAALGELLRAEGSSLSRRVSTEEVLLLISVKDILSTEGHFYGHQATKRAGYPTATVFNSLSKLETDGVLQSHWEKPRERQQRDPQDRRAQRRVYEITELGHRVFDTLPSEPIGLVSTLREARNSVSDLLRQESLQGRSRNVGTDEALLLYGMSDLLATNDTFYTLQLAKHAGYQNGPTSIMLRRFEEDGIITSHTEPSKGGGVPRRVYTLTNLGQRALGLLR